MSILRAFSNRLSFLCSLPPAATAAIQVLLASCLLALVAQVKISLSFTPIPLTLQTIAVMGIGALLGSRLGALATLAYLAQGGLGLPVFAGGNLGLLYFFGPTGGYLVGFVVQAFVVGWFFARRPSLHLKKKWGIFFFATLLQLSLGALWLTKFMGWSHAISQGIFPFLVGDALKAALLAACLPAKNRAYSPNS